MGGTKTMKVKVRVIAATNKDLEEEIGAGRFRRDLFYRLNEISLRLPPLRDRREDIPMLVEYFIRSFQEQYSGRYVSPAVMRHLTDYQWPGNVR